MAECSYARCLQERRLIKRELMKWSKDVLHIVGLERIAEELMGRRKWKHYHEALTRTHLTNTEQLTATIEQLNIEPKTNINGESCMQNDITTTTTTQVENTNGVNHQQQQVHHNNNKNNNNNTNSNNQQTLAFEESEEHDQRNGKEQSDDQAVSDKVNTTTTITTTATQTQDHHSLENHKEHTHSNTNGNGNNSHHSNSCSDDGRAVTPTPITPPPPLSEPIDWKPNEKCNFCVNGKLLTVNAKGELVAESGPIVSETDHVNHSNNKLDSDSDSDESSTVNFVGHPHTNNTNNNNNNNNNSKHNNNNNNNSSRVTLNNLLATANMTSMDSMAAIAAFQSIEQYYPNWLHLAQQQQQQQQQQQAQQQQQQQQQQQTHSTNSATPTTSETSAAAVSPHPLKDSPSPSDATGEQPLDLSSKPSPNSSISGDLKAVRTKSPRATPVLPLGRRPYSDEDLSNALQEILSGRLGTRKASVQYNVPRSTLRNKVNKLNNPQAALDLLHLHHERDLSDDGGDDDGDGDDDRDQDTHTSNTSTPQLPTDLPPTTLEELAKRMTSTASLRKMCASNGSAEMAANPSPKPDGRQSGTPLSLGGVSQPQTSPHPSTTPMGPLRTDATALLQTLISLGAYQQKLDQTVTFRELINAIILNMSAVNMKDTFGATTSAGVQPSAAEALLTATPTSTTTSTTADTKSLDPLLLLQQLQQYQPQQRLLKSETPETASSLDPSEVMCGDDGSPTTILKIPSVKLVAGTSGGGSVAVPGVGGRASMSPALLCNSANSLSNNCQRSVHSPNSSSMLAAAVAATAKSRKLNNNNNNNNNNISPSLLHAASQMDATQLPSSSSYNIRDVMANSIHQKMTEQANQEVADLLAVNLKTEHGSNGGSSGYKKPSISVVKNIGGTDTSRFGAAPNLLANSHHHHHHHQHQHQHPTVGHLQHAHQPPHVHPHHHHHHSPPHHHLSRQEAAALAAGKGTRPKRGKYRNYDRDSLVEAVKAVQRGEMSVHRAGSYYGVPHSTLEYKVKERHLMRPRKREPKPQPGLDGSSGTSSKANSSHIPGQNDKARRETNSSASSSGANSKLSNALKNNAASATAAFPNAVTANGLKLPMYDAATAAAVAAQLPYSQLFWPNSSPYNQLQMGLGRNVAGSGASPNDLISSHIQRYQEEAMRAAGLGSSNNNNNNNSNNTTTSASNVAATVGTSRSAAISPIASPLGGQNHHHLHHPHQMALNIKSARELADNFYESGEANGSAILDGVIRTTLNRKSEGIPSAGNGGVGGGALLDQLLVKKTPMPFTNNRANDYASTSHLGAAPKRAGSPLNYSDIKRERSSPLHSSDNDDDDDDEDEDASRSACDTTEENYEHNNNNNNSRSSNKQPPPPSQLHTNRNSRMTSNDSEDSSLHSDFHAKSSHNSSAPPANMPDLSNGGSNSGVGRQQSPQLAVKPDADPAMNNNNAATMAVTSILQDKLVQIKAEQEQEQENL